MYVVFLCLLVRVCLIIIIVTAFLSIQTARQPYSTQVWFDGMWDGVVVKEIPPPYPTKDYSKDECVHRGILNSNKEIKQTEQTRASHSFLSLSLFHLFHSLSLILSFHFVFSSLFFLRHSPNLTRPSLPQNQRICIHIPPFPAHPPSLLPPILAWLGSTTTTTS